MTKIINIPILDNARNFRKELEVKTITTFSFGDGPKHMIKTDLKEGDLVKLFHQSQNDKKLKR